jgi:hypothetical protein
MQSARPTSVVFAVDPSHQPLTGELRLRSMLAGVRTAMPVRYRRPAAMDALLGRWPGVPLSTIFVDKAITPENGL